MDNENLLPSSSKHEDEESYIQNRINSKVLELQDKASHALFIHKFIVMLRIICASSITILPHQTTSLIVGALAITITISTVIDILNSYHERSIRYSSLAQNLRHEKHLYLSGCQPYHAEDRKEAFREFVESIESILSTYNEI